MTHPCNKYFFAVIVDELKTALTTVPPADWQTLRSGLTAGNQFTTTVAFQTQPFQPEQNYEAMPKGTRSSPSATSAKRKGRPPKKKSRDSSGRAGVDEGDDFDYTGEESDQSFGEDDIDNLSDTDSLRGKKRGRKAGSASRDERPKRQPGTPVASASPSLDPDSDYDEHGETKVDRGGNLLGGRQYKVPTFNLPNRGRMLFMFSKDPAALLGFRDSFVFLKKNPKLVKVHVTDAEKGFLVQHNLLRSTFRTREVSVVTARSVYKQFGHRVLRKGRRGRDDYYYTGEDEGDFDEHSEEETKDANDKSWSPFAVSGRNNLTSNSRRTPIAASAAASKMSAPVITETNWMHHVALSIRNFNTQLCEYRRDNPSFFDLHTNVHQIPASKQPLRLLYEMTESPLKKESSQETGEIATGENAPAEKATAQQGAGFTEKNEQDVPSVSSSASAALPMTAASAATVPTPAVPVAPQSLTSAPPSSLPVSTPSVPQMAQVPQQPGQYPATTQQQQHAIRQMQAQQAAAAGHPMYFQQMAGNRPPQVPMGGPMGAYHPQQQQMMMQHASANGVYAPNTSMAPMGNNPYPFMHQSGTM
ncbi:chromatin remodelling complex Rsc7/Swp82 subunit-domain-containing protein [Zychaea mexicana]|uniref:chromatin remodelling complex Rsc7/Swp82 subunit-domain-containing protein n=1 Tax=Zychaea mexicana TaxID=64656 RepID=UPI0022FEB788|nr:chromatin remodelling complex Rsc7/Swp82 subunit-domain-containing protein [Zychaea mexicana]KAI9490162.1 chromatin remodelling complex Rsc7/Swp82 subunit-domain-containing protein [Zychaea mexicana]